MYNRKLCWGENMKLLKRFLNYLEKIGLIKKKSELNAVEVKEPVISNEQTEASHTEEEPILSPLFASSNEYTQKKDDLSDYKFGDIIWARRYSNEEEKATIPKGHREGPYIVVESNNDYLICLYSTGTEPKVKSSEYRILTLSEANYHDVLTKETYVQVAISRQITNEEITSYLGSLISKDKTLLRKKIGICKDEGLYVEAEPSCPYISLEQGDIFAIDKEQYLILSSSKESKTCLPLKLSNEPNVIVIDGIRYIVDYKNSVVLRDVSMYRRTNVINKKLLAAITLRYQNYLAYQKSYGLITRGSIITLHGKYYLVNGEIGDSYTAYQVFTGDNHLGMIDFYIAGEKYSSDFNNQITFFKKEHPYQFRATATEEEMEKFKEVKKSYQRKVRSKSNKHRKNNVKVDYPNITSGSIVVDPLKNKRYIVITRHESQLIVMAETDYDEFNYQLAQIDVHEVSAASRMHPIAFKTLLNELKSKVDVIKGHVSQEHLKKLIAEHI